MKNSKETFPNLTGSISFTKSFLESLVWDEMGKVDINVLIYFYGQLTWKKKEEGSKNKKRKKDWVARNNGDLKISIEIMAKRLKVSRVWASKSVHRLIKWGVIRPTEYGGNHTCHTYKILVNCNIFNAEQVCTKKEEMWRKYNGKLNWAHFCPKAPSNMKNKSKDELTNVNGYVAQQKTYVNGLGSVSKVKFIDKG